MRRLWLLYFVIDHEKAKKSGVADPSGCREVQQGLPSPIETVCLSVQGNISSGQDRIQGLSLRQDGVFAPGSGDTGGCPGKE